MTEPIQVPTIGEPELPAETVTDRKLEEIIQGSRVIHARHQGFTKAMARKLLAVEAERDALKAEFDDCAKHLIFLQPAQSADEWGEPIWRLVKPRMDALRAELATARQIIARLSAPVSDAETYLLQVIEAARDVLMTFQHQLGYLPEQKAYSTKMTENEMLCARTINDLTGLIAARKDANNDKEKA
jgi:hypothetical protein